MEPPGRQSWKPRDRRDVSWSQRRKAENSWSGEAQVAAGLAGAGGREPHRGRWELAGGPGWTGGGRSNPEQRDAIPAMPTTLAIAGRRSWRTTALGCRHLCPTWNLSHSPPAHSAPPEGEEWGASASRGTRALTDTGVTRGLTARVPLLIPALAPPGCAALRTSPLWASVSAPVPWDHCGVAEDRPPRCVRCSGPCLQLAGQPPPGDHHRLYLQMRRQR